MTFAEKMLSQRGPRALMDKKSSSYRNFAASLLRMNS
jgi:hypothetical protein